MTSLMNISVQTRIQSLYSVLYTAWCSRTSIQLIFAQKLLKLALLILFCENTILLPLFCITSNSPTDQAVLVCNLFDTKQGLMILWQQHCNAKHNKCRLSKHITHHVLNTDNTLCFERSFYSLIHLKQM